MSEEKKKRINFRVHLSGNKYILGDSICYWIASESHRRGKDGNQITVQKRLSGYYTEFVPLVDSYFRKTLKNAEIDGELEDLMKLVTKTRAEIKRWFKVLDKVIKEEERD